MGHIPLPLNLSSFSEPLLAIRLQWKWQTWLLRLGKKRLCTFCFCFLKHLLLGCFISEPSYHAVRNPNHIERTRVGACCRQWPQLSTQPTASIDYQLWECTTLDIQPGQAFWWLQSCYHLTATDERSWAAPFPNSWSTRSWAKDLTGCFKPLSFGGFVMRNRCSELPFCKPLHQ